MKTQDPNEDLQDGFEVGPMAPPGADGGVSIADPPPPHPRLCEAGPCRHYHRLAVQVDETQPGAIRVPIALPGGMPGVQAVPGGSVYRPPGAFHVQVHHYCYPDVGIEMPLGDVPVTECNRWEPRTTRIQTPKSEGLGEYVAAVAAWEVDRAKREQEAADIERSIEESLAMASKGDLK